MTRRVLSPSLLWLAVALPAAAASQAFRCAGIDGGWAAPAAADGAGKPAAPVAASAAVLVLFAHFADEDRPALPPAWAAALLDPQVPGSVAHFYDEMSFGRHRLRGGIAPRWYASSGPAVDYVNDDPGRPGQYGRLAREILAQADADVDFRRYDSDGPDGLPDSGDDDGIVDAVLLDLASVPEGLIAGPATGVAGLGFDEPFVTGDIGRSGRPVVIDPRQGTVQAAPDAGVAAGTMAHEYGHLLGLIDLYDVQWTNDPGDPDGDSAGIGRWGLMGWGAEGWDGTPGPSSLSAWSRLRLGWARVEELVGLETTVQLQPVARGGHLLRIPIAADEYLLVEDRRRDASFYDRGIPGEGLLVWDVRRVEANGFRWLVDLVCADGRWADAGYPLGTQPAPRTGGDNLDFWAHDAAWSVRHGGNKGDATDPFDGVRFRALTGDTNPAIVNAAGVAVVRLEDITLAPDGTRLTVRLLPPALEITDVRPGSARVMAGAAVSLLFTLRNAGTTPARGLRVEVTSDDPDLEVVDPAIDLYPLEVGDSSIGLSLGPDGFPRVRFRPGLAETRTARVELAVYADTLLLARAATWVTGVPSHAVTITVVDPDGRPVTGVPVTVSGVGEAWYEPRQTTDAAGRVVAYLGSGVYTIEATPGNSTAWGTGAVRDRRVDADAGIVMSLPRLFTVSGRVRLDDGQPASDVYVYLVPQDRQVLQPMAWVDAEGRFSMRVPAGAYQVQTYFASSAVYQPQDHGVVEVTADTSLDLQVSAGPRLRVTVVAPDGRPVVGAQVLVRSVGGPGYANSLVPAGTTNRVLAGTYILSVYQAPLPFVASGRDSVLVAVTADTTVTLIVRRGLLVEASLVDSTGRVHTIPRNSVYVSLSIVDSATGESFSVSLSGGPARFRLGLRPGTYAPRVDVSVYSDVGASDVQPPFPSQALGSFTVAADTALALVMSPGVTVEGLLLGQAYRPAQYDQIVFYRPTGHDWHGVPLRRDGTFTTRLMPGDYSVWTSFNGDDHPPSQTLGSVAVRGDTTLTLELRRTERLEGRLVGLEIAGVTVSAQRDSGDQWVYNWAVTGADGSFAMQLPAGRFTLRAGRRSINWRLRQIDVPALGEVRLLLPEGATFEASIVDDLGRPVGTFTRLALYHGRFTLADHMRQSAGFDSFAVEAYLHPDGPGGPSTMHLSIDLAPGPYYAVAQTEYSDAARVLPDLVADGVSPLVVVVPPAPRGARLSGRLVLPEGQAPSAVRVAAYDAATQVLVLATAASGTYELTLAPGTYQLAASYDLPDGAHIWVRPGPVVVDGETQLDLRLDVPTAVTDAAATPHAFALEAGYPNPFNATTSIAFCLAQAGPARLAVYALTGQRIRDLVRGDQPAGPQRVLWDGRDDEGRPVASGVYLLQLRAGARQATGKLLLLR